MSMSTFGSYAVGSRTSSGSAQSIVPGLGRADTRGSRDGGRSMRQSKRYSVTALYLSMNANQRDLEIEDDLAKGIKMMLFKMKIH